MEVQEERQAVLSFFSRSFRKNVHLPQPTNTAHVRLNPTKQGYSAITVCHRSVTDLKRDHVLFSLSTPTYDNGFLTFWQNQNQEIQSYVGTGSVAYGGWDYKPNTWHSICTTWDSVTGLVQIWFDGKPSIRKFVHSGAITQTVIVLLGQDQDSHGGRFDINQSFVGMMSDVHMWDYTLSPFQHISWSEAQFTHVVLDLTWRKGVVPHVDISYHTNKTLVNVKPPTMAVLLLWGIQSDKRGKIEV
uniref:Pentraxin family member n=1 Tax=Oryzias latipes TaxID=8090 RepID=A0A3P9IEK7_ORYLA